jgi:HTH-type transcriptional regulator/antitoxin HigA
MKISPIRTESDYREALTAIEHLFDSEPGTTEGDQLEVLAILVEDYERKTAPASLPDPIDAILHEMDRLDLTVKDLEPHIGSRSRVWEVLNRRRRLTLDMIRRLSAALDIPAAILVREYPLADQGGATVRRVTDRAHSRAGRPHLPAASQ